MSDLPEARTQDESADVLMHNGQQYVRIDYLTRLHAKVEMLRGLLKDVERVTRHPDYDWPIYMQKEVDKAIEDSEL